MNKREFARRLEERTKQFALQIIRLSAGLSRSPEALVIRNKITKSATSIGANYREANRSLSRADFKNRIKICESEASETQYWLELVSASGYCLRQSNERSERAAIKKIKSKFIMKSVWTGFLFPVFFALTSIAHAYDVTLAWDPNAEPDLAGYNVYVNQAGPGPPYYQLDTISLDEIEPGAPLYTASELNLETYYCFVVTAYDSEGSESGFSNEVCVLNGAEVALSLTQERGGGGGCFIHLSSE